MGPWLVDIESLERLTQDEDGRRLVLRMAQLARDGRLQPFLHEVADDTDLEQHTRDAIAELGEDEAFLLAVEEYVARTRVHH